MKLAFRQDPEAVRTWHEETWPAIRARVKADDGEILFAGQVGIRSDRVTGRTWGVNSKAYTPLRLPGQYHDAETGLHYNYFRHYGPEAARYLTPGPARPRPGAEPVDVCPEPAYLADPLGLSLCPPYLFREPPPASRAAPECSGTASRLPPPTRRRQRFRDAGWFGDAIVEVYPCGALDGVRVHEGYLAREAEWPVELSPAELLSRASVQVPSATATATATEILSENGHPRATTDR